MKIKTWAILTAAGCAAIVGVPLLVTVAVSGSGSASAATTCASGAIPITNVPQLNRAQLNNAAVIVRVGMAGRMTEFGMDVAVAVAYQESKLKILANSNVPESLNLPHEGVGSDHDSVGLFQQRANWGTVPERMDAIRSSQLFYGRLVDVPNWQHMALTDAAQAVQGSATPTAYAQWEQLARRVVQTIDKAVPTDCMASYSSPVSGRAGVAINHAMLALGTSYVFGGTCTDPHSADPTAHCDCSSLVQQAWKAAGVNLPRTSEDQYNTVPKVAGITAVNVVQSAQAGMLLFYNWGKDNRPGPGHVAMAVGNGYLIEAPQPGELVHIIPIYTTSFVSAGVIP